MDTPSLLERFARLTDPRRRRGRRPALESLPAPAAVARRSGMTSLEAIAHFGRLRGPRLTTPVTVPPCVRTSLPGLDFGLSVRLKPPNSW